MRRLAFLFLMGILLLPGTLVRAQGGEVVFDSVLVDVWPEYDQPGVLVMYTLKLADSVALPAEVSIRIPGTVKAPHAVAVRDVNGLYNLNYDNVRDGEWSRLTFTTSMPDLRIEYYDPGLQIKDQQRDFTYRWPADAAVNSLTVQVQQPMGGSNLTAVPPLGTGRQAEDGLMYYTLVMGAAPAGQPVEVNLRYTKANNDLTNPNSFQAVQPTAPLGDATTGRVTLTQALPWVLGGLGIVVIGAALWYYGRAWRGTTTPARARHRHTAARDKAANAESAQGDGAYCANCGRRAAVGDTFCRACGTRLRL